MRINPFIICSLSFALTVGIKSHYDRNILCAYNAVFYENLRSGLKSTQEANFHEQQRLYNEGYKAVQNDIAALWTFKYWGWNLVINTAGFLLNYYAEPEIKKEIINDVQFTMQRDNISYIVASGINIILSIVSIIPPLNDGCYVFSIIVAAIATSYQDEWEIVSCAPEIIIMNEISTENY